MVTGTGLGVGSKVLKQERLGLCLQMGTDPEGEKGPKAPSQQCDRALKGVYCFSNLMTLRFGERSEFRIFEKEWAYLEWKDCLLRPWKGNVW